MASWRFKASKYKNAAPITPKKEDCLSDIKVGNPQSCGSHVRASAAFVAYMVENRGGGSLGVVPLTSCKGRQCMNSPMIHAHTDLVTDFAFSPFHDGLLATCSADTLVHLWHIPPGGLSSHLSTPEITLDPFERRVELVAFHPTADGLLSVCCGAAATLWDIHSGKRVYGYSDHSEQIQGVAWSWDGQLMATVCRDRCVRVIDPRARTPASKADNHASPKDSKVSWLSGNTRLLTTGWDSSRAREVKLRDLRNMDSPYKTLSLDASTGILVPLYDPDTNMLFLAGKADVGISYWEVTEGAPHLVEGVRHGGSVQTKGACLVPKRGLDVMSGEVNRILQLTATSIIPITYQVPRKSYREFHRDIYPDTTGPDPACSVTQWLAGSSAQVTKVSLDPARRPTPVWQVHRGPLSDLVPGEWAGPPPPSSPTQPHPVPAPRSKVTNGKIQEAPPPRPALRSSFNNNNNKNNNNKNSSQSQPRTLRSIDQSEGREGRAVDQSGNSGSSSSSSGSGTGVEILKRNFMVENKHHQQHNRHPETTTTTTTTTTTNISFIKRNYQIKEVEGGPEGEEEGRAKLASIRKQFENSSTADDKKKDGAKEEEEEEEEEKENARVETETASPHPPRRPTLTRSFRRVCKFRHLRGTPGHKSSCIDNLRDLSRTIPSESDGLAANSKWVALPLSGAGGRIAVLSHTQPKRLMEGVIPSLVNSNSVTDFAFDPFNPNVLAVACDDGKINVWTIPEGGLKEPTNTPTDTLIDLTSSDKVTALRYHPTASGVLAAITGGRNVVKLWDTHLPRITLTLQQHPDQIFSGAWSWCGRMFATLCRDGAVRVYDPRKSTTPILSGSGGGGGGGRGGRILWGPKDDLIITTGFSRVSERQISIYSAHDVSKPLNTVVVDVSPAILTPYFDPDSSVLLTTGKGDSTIYAYEVGVDSPHLFPLTHHKSSTVHQGLVALPKILCDVRVVEFLKMLRLTSCVLEPLSFTVPRVKTEFFQDDLFPPTRITWEAVMTAAEWFGGTTRPPRTLSLQPQDMISLSESRDPPAPSPPGSTAINHQHPNHHHHIRHQTPPFLKGMVPTEVRQTQHKLEESLSQQMTEVTTSLEQDRMEGVDSAEWED